MLLLPLRNAGLLTPSNVEKTLSIVNQGGHKSNAQAPVAST